MVNNIQVGEPYMNEGLVGEDEIKDVHSGNILVWDRNNAILPKGFQKVEWVGRNGNNYIDTGRVPKLSEGFEVQVGYKMDTAGVRHGILSNYNGNSGEEGLTSLEINDGSKTNNVVRFYTEHLSGSNSYNIFSSNTLNTSSFNDIIFKTDGENSSGSINLNGTVTTGTAYTGGYSNLSAYMFIDRGLRRNTFTKNSFISYCRIYEGGNLVRNFIPCYRKTDNVIGFYDIVNGKFYTNLGNGTFTKGPNI